jgi:hypothetical protein
MPCLSLCRLRVQMHPLQPCRVLSLPLSEAACGWHRRCVRRSKTGYHMRKTFGPPGDPPSRADSFVGGPWYDDSYHSQDTRRSALPTHLLPGGGAAASLHASVQPPGRSAPPSLVNLFFPESSVRGGPTNGSGRAAQLGGYGRSGSSHGVRRGAGGGRGLHLQSFVGGVLLPCCCSVWVV